MPALSQAQKIVIGFNCVTAILGFSVMFASFYARGKINAQGWGVLVSNNVSAVGVAAGLCTLLLSFIGCVAAAAKQKKMLCCYLVGFVLVVALQIAAAATMAQYSNSLSLRDASLPSSRLTFGPDITLNNMVFSVFMKCCSGCPSGLCNNPAPGCYSNQTTSNCLPIPPSNASLCHQLTPCDVASEAKCFYFYYGEPQVMPPICIQDSVCKALSIAWSGGSYIVGPVSQGRYVTDALNFYVASHMQGNSCGGGDPVVFLRQMDQFVGESLDGVAGFFVFVSVLEACAFPAGLYILCCTRAKAKVANEEEIGLDGADLAQEQSSTTNERNENNSKRNSNLATI